MLPLLLALVPLSAQAPSRVVTFPVDGVERKALVYPGGGAAPATGRPLVLAFHGHGGTMRSSARKADVHTVWPEATVIYPEGLPAPGMTDPNGERNGWQKRPGALGDRDLKFVDAILAGTKGYDPKRVYAMGHSNGGRMVYVLWAARSERFAAYGPSGSPAGLLVGRLAPAPFLATAGETDPLVSYESQMRGIEAIMKRTGAELSKARKTGFLHAVKGTGGIEVGAYLFPGGHEYPAEAIAATVALFKRTSR